MIEYPRLRDDVSPIALSRFEALNPMTTFSAVKVFKLNGVTMHRKRGFALFLNQEWSEDNGGHSHLVSHVNLSQDSHIEAIPALSFRTRHDWHRHPAATAV